MPEKKENWGEEFVDEDFDTCLGGMRDLARPDFVAFLLSLNLMAGCGSVSTQKKLEQEMFAFGAVNDVLSLAEAGEQVDLPHDLWKEKCAEDPKSLVGYINVKARSMACGLFKEQKSGYEGIESKAVRDAVNVLTSVKVKLHSNGEDQDFYSGDFRDHPHFDEHFAVLHEAWGSLPLTDKRRKTLEIMKVLVDHRESANFPINEVYEVLWRRIDGEDIFMMGFQHTDEYYAQNRAWLSGLATYSDYFVIEGFGDVEGTNAPIIYFDEESDFGYGPYIRDLSHKNKEAVFVELDPRGSEEFRLDNPAIAVADTYSDYFLAEYYLYLRDYSDRFEQDSEPDVDLMREIFTMGSLSPDGVFSSVEIYSVDRAMEYNPNYFTNESAQFTTNPEDMMIGLVGYTDALIALKMRKLLEKVSAEAGRVEGPIVQLVGAAHIDRLKVYLDDPVLAAKVVMENLHFLLADRIGVDGEIDELITFLNQQGIDTGMDLNAKISQGEDPFEIYFTNFTDGNPVVSETFIYEFNSVFPNAVIELDGNLVRKLFMVLSKR